MDEEKPTTEQTETARGARGASPKMRDEQKSDANVGAQRAIEVDAIGVSGLPSTSGCSAGISEDPFYRRRTALELANGAHHARKSSDDQIVATARAFEKFLNEG